MGTKPGNRDSAGVELHLMMNAIQSMYLVRRGSRIVDASD